MSRLITDLQAILSQLTAEYSRLLQQLEHQHVAMKKFNLGAMADLMPLQECTRLRIGELEHKRRTIMRQLTATLKLPQEPRLTKIAELFPSYAPALLKARNDLRDLAAKISHRSHGSGRLASAVLGHLNTVLRILAGAAQRAGLYTRRGIPSVAERIGVMDAVG
jgi:hypothetical protein